MEKIEDGIEIQCPVEKVFAFATDAARWGKWVAFIPVAEKTSPGPVGPDSTFKGSARMLGRTMEWTAKTTEFEPNRKFGKDITSGPVFIGQHNTFEPTEKGTRLTISYEVKVSGFLRLMSSKIERSMREGLHTSLSTLKKVLEA